jgi:glycosyltransferase 2 family protein
MRTGSRPVRLLIQGALTVLVTWVIVRQVGVTLDEALALDAAVPRIRPLVLAGSVLLLAGCFALTARMWGWMVRELGGTDPGWLGSNRIVLTANLGRYLPGKVWQVAGLAVLSRREGIPATLATCAGVLTQAFHLAGAAVVGAFVLAGGEVVGGGAWIAWGLLVLFVVLVSIPGLLHRALRIAFRLARLDPGEAPRTDVLFGSRWLLLHVLVWGGYGLAFALLVRGFGLSEPALPLVAAFSAAYLLGYLAIFAPAGLGVREGALIAFLRPSVGAAAVGVAVLARLWMTVVELVPAGVFAYRVIYREGSGMEEPEGEGLDG